MRRISHAVGIQWEYRHRKSQREERQVMKIDTEIRHVTKLGANLFLELGFSPEEAKRLQAASKNRSTTRSCSRSSSWPNWRHGLSNTT